MLHVFRNILSLFPSIHIHYLNCQHYCQKCMCQRCLTCQTGSIIQELKISLRNPTISLLCLMNINVTGVAYNSETMLSYHTVTKNSICYRILDIINNCPGWAGGQVGRWAGGRS